MTVLLPSLNGLTIIMQNQFTRKSYNYDTVGFTMNGSIVQKSFTKINSVNSFHLGCTNGFVNVQYNSADSTISCTFLKPMDTSIKSCRVTYGQCGQRQTQTDEKFSTVALPNNITLSVMPGSSYCYTVTASNGNFTASVEGRIQSK